MLRGRHVRAAVAAAIVVPLLAVRMWAVGSAAPAACSATTDPDVLLHRGRRDLGGTRRRHLGDLRRVRGRRRPARVQHQSGRTRRTGNRHDSRDAGQRRDDRRRRRRAKSVGSCSSGPISGGFNGGGAAARGVRRRRRWRCVRRPRRPGDALATSCARRRRRGRRFTVKQRSSVRDAWWWCGRRSDRC